MNVLEGNCPNCGNKIRVNLNTEMICPYCNSKFSVIQAIQNYNNTYDKTHNTQAEKVSLNNNECTDGLIIKNGIVKEYIGTDKHISIPNGVIVIERLHSKGHEDNKYTESVYLPPSVKEVSFYAMTNLKKVFPLSNVEVLSYGAFSGTKVRELDLRNVKEMNGAFIESCYELEILKVSREFFDKYHVIRWNEGAYCKTRNPKLNNIYIDDKMLTINSKELQCECFEGTAIYEEWENLKRARIHKRWKMQGLCQYCGGKIKFWGNKCEKCGKIKDY